MRHSGRTLINLFSSYKNVSVRTLLLQPPPPGCSNSCAVHALTKARSERPSERPAKALPQQGRSGDAGHNEAHGQAGGAIDHSNIVRTWW